MEDVSQIVFVLPTYLQIIVHKSLEKEMHTKYLGRIPSLIGSLTPLQNGKWLKGSGSALLCWIKK